mgnify:FL=1
MKIAVLASGSKGNCTYVETLKTKSLIDAGMTNLYIETKLKGLGINPDDIENIFITHDHVDHVSALKVFVKRHNVKVFLTQKLYDELSKTINFTNYEILEGKVYLSDTIVTYFKTSHDAVDSVGYVFESDGKDFVYVTDTGYINNKYFDLLKNRCAYVFESNHDVTRLMENPNYPYNTKQRILSDKGHLSNKDSAYYLSNFVGNKTKTIILAHLSEQNNTKELALEEISKRISNVNINIANQNEPTELVTL